MTPTETRAGTRAGPTAPTLEANLARLDRLLLEACERRRWRGPDTERARELAQSLLEEHAAADPTGAPCKLPELGQTYGLSPWQLDLLLFAVAQELDARYLALWRLLESSPGGALSVGLAADIAGLGVGERATALASLLPSSPLLRFELLLLRGDGPLAERRITLSPSVLGRVAGLSQQESCAPLLEPGPKAVDALALSPSIRSAMDAAAAVLARDGVVLVTGPPGSGRDAIAEALAGLAGLRALKLAGPPSAEELPAIRRDTRWWKAAALLGSGHPPASALLQQAELPVVQVLDPQTSIPDLHHERRFAVLQVSHLGPEERARVWTAGTRDKRLGADLGRRYRFGPGRVAQVLGLVEDTPGKYGRRLTPAAIHQAAAQLRHARFEGLAQRVATDRGWDDLVVTGSLHEELGLALSWLRHGQRVFGEWGLGRGLDGALGLSCLFHGPPGTGKTLGARVLAAELGLDLYRVDLSQVVNKYIGETEKNLARLFDEARASDVMLFFDEADALFGRRTQVSDAHDRHANVETGYLLQRLEAHEGPVVLASNLLANLDPAFLRRMYVVGAFMLPGPEERERIWALHLPKPSGRGEDLDVRFLARRFSLSGAEIRNATITAGLLAAKDGGAVKMAHLARAVAREMRKTGRVVEPAKFGLWAASLSDV